VRRRNSTDGQSSRTLPGFLLATLLCLSGAGAAGAHETADLRVVADRLVGGASLLTDLTSSGASRGFHDHAHRFQETVRSGRWKTGQLRSDWERLRRAFEEAERSLSRRRTDERIGFLLAHLEDEIESGSRLVSGAPGAGGGTTEQWIGLLQGETCVGVQNVGPRPCPRPREGVSFRVPRGVTQIRRFRGEWRDFGGGARALVLLDGQPVWQTDVGKDWEADARSVNLRVRPGQTLTIQSVRGDPFWVRRFDIEPVGDGDGYRFPY